LARIERDKIIRFEKKQILNVLPQVKSVFERANFLFYLNKKTSSFRQSAK